jgi:monoamine oxidase
MVAQQSSLMPTQHDSYHSVVVVGAGLAGLYAAHLLNKHFPDVIVVEAQNRIGGRVKQV